MFQHFINFILLYSLYTECFSLHMSELGYHLYRHFKEIYDVNPKCYITKHLPAGTVLMPRSTSPSYN